MIGIFLLATNSTAQVQLADARGKNISLSAPAQRIVSLAPHITEIAYAAGAGGLLVGAVSFSDYPEQAVALPQIGSYDRVNYERLLALQPDLVIAWLSGNGEETINRIEALGIPVFAQEPKALDDIAKTLREIGKLTGHTDAAGASAADVEKTLSELRARYSEQAKVEVYYQIWNEPLLTLNGNHLISDVIRLCGGRNVFADAVPLVSRVGIEAVVRADPQVIVASGMDQARPEWLDDWRAWTSMQAVANNQLYFVPPDLLQRHTPRILQGAAMLCEHLQVARGFYAAKTNSQKDELEPAF